MFTWGNNMSVNFYRAVPRRNDKTTKPYIPYKETNILGNINFY